MQTLESFCGNVMDRNEQIVAQFQFGLSAEQIADGMSLKLQIVRNVLAMRGLAYTNDQPDAD